jgi:hypothetical protein
MVLPAIRPRRWLVVINKFNVFRAFCSPDEANPEPIIHPDRMLAFAVAFERVKPIGWRRPQIVQGGGGV